MLQHQLFGLPYRQAGRAYLSISIIKQKSHTLTVWYSLLHGFIGR